MAGNDQRGTADVCDECGAAGQSDVFCDSCGAVLRARALGAETPGGSDPSGSAGFEDHTLIIPSTPSAADVLTALSGDPAPYSDYASVPAPLPRVQDEARRSPAAPTASTSPTSPTASAAFIQASGETAGEQWDAVAEWSHVLADQEPDTPPAPASAAAAPAVGAPSTIVPPSRGPYEFTSRRPEAFPPGAGVGPTPQGSPLEVPQSLNGLLVSRTDEPAPSEAGPGHAVSASFSAEPAQYPGSSTSTLMPYEHPGPATPTPTGTPSEMELRARELIVPVADRAPVERIVPVPPGMPDTARPTVRTPQLHEVTGGVPCPWCGTPNPVDRHFCRRCAMSLAAHPGGARRKVWWRRLLNWRRRPVPYAGQRPRLRHGIGRVVRWTVWATVLVVLAFEIDWHAGTAVMDVEDHFITPVETPADSWSVPHSLPAYPAKNLYNGYYNTWWGSNVGGTSTGVTLTAKFNQPIDLLDLIITPGAGTDPSTFDAESRPETMDMTLVKADGSTTKTTLGFNDAAGPATFKVRANDVSSIVFTIESAYLGSGPAATTYVAITQIEFYTRSLQHS